MAVLAVYVYLCVICEAIDSIYTFENEITLLKHSTLHSNSQIINYILTRFYPYPQYKECGVYFQRGFIIS